KSVFQKGQIPEDIQTIQVEEDGFDLIEVLVANEIVKSKSEVRRLASQGGVKVNGEKVEDLSTIVKESELVVQIGKKKFVKIELVK
ncbi:S4 domain-containing protein, partial [Escherichia coli]|uniref:S4 domain-containing protein n=2 Tax=Bacteria TaxID=2 RepID=UPI00202CFC08